MGAAFRQPVSYEGAIVRREVAAAARKKPSNSTAAACNPRSAVAEALRFAVREDDMNVRRILIAAVVALSIAHLAELSRAAAQVPTRAGTSTARTAWGGAPSR